MALLKSVFPPCDVKCLDLSSYDASMCVNARGEESPFHYRWVLAISFMFSKSRSWQKELILN